MQQIAELLETGQYEELEIDSLTQDKTLQDYVNDLDLDGIRCAVLVNGKKEDMDYVLKKDDKVVVIPEIKGG